MSPQEMPVVLFAGDRTRPTIAQKVTWLEREGFLVLPLTTARAVPQARGIVLHAVNQPVFVESIAAAVQCHACVFLFSSSTPAPVAVPGYTSAWCPVWFLGLPCWQLVSHQPAALFGQHRR